MEAMGLGRQRDFVCDRNSLEADHRHLRRRIMRDEAEDCLRFGINPGDPIGGQPRELASAVQAIH